MNSEKEGILLTKYRELFPPDEIMHDMTKSCMAWGLDVRDGWFDILDRAFSKLISLESIPTLAQVKEKFGGLRIYLDNSSDEAYAIVNAAEIESEKTCEICGQPGVNTETSGWYATRCEKHSAKRI